MTITYPTRESALAHLATSPSFDVIVVGGGATGLGTALDAASRGLKVALFESHDFASGTSSRATKLVHGGVRYLAQGHIPLVREALRERTRLLNNAPHNAHAQPFVMPSYQWWETPFYGVGLKAYDLLAGAHSLGKTEFLSKAHTLEALPGLRSEGLTGGVRYWDGQFNDARLAIDLARTAQAHGALLLNYCKVEKLIEDAGVVSGVEVMDIETGVAYKAYSRCVINATGVWVDGLRGATNGASKKETTKAATSTTPSKSPLVRPSRGVHVVVSADFMPTQNAMMIPKTRDGRVLFIVPWLGHLILGTTDTPVDTFDREPQADKADIDFILSEAAHYLNRAPTRADILSTWAGLRPLVQDTSAGSTKAISREHTIEIAANRLLTVTGGKWTTYRSMAADVMTHALDAGLLLKGTPQLCVTENLRLLGADSPCNQTDLAAAGEFEFVRFAVQYEFARCAEDVLARRSRTLFLNAQKTAELSEAVAAHLYTLGITQPKGEALCSLVLKYSQ